MSARSRDRIFRQTLSALIGSKMSTADLRELINYIDGDSSFRSDLCSSLAEITRRQSESHPSFEWSEEIEVEEIAEDVLVDLIFDIVSRKRMPKRELASILYAASPSIASRISTESSAREMLSYFLSKASTKGRRELLRTFGMDVEEDPYLGGISNRNKG